MHDAGFVHGSLAWRDILIRPNGQGEFEFAFLDPQRVRLYRLVGFRRFGFLHDVSTLAATAMLVCSRADRLRFARAYLGRQRLNRRDLKWLNAITRRAEPLVERERHRMEVNEIFVPDVIFAARAMTAGMELLQPILAAKGIEPVGRAIIGTVKGDLHDIGKNLVGMMLQGAGFNVVDLGIDVPPEKFVDAVKTQSCSVVGLSALLTTTMPQMKNVIDALKESGVAAKVIIGGAPVTQNYADEIGADGYAPDAASAVDVAKELIA